jgi:lipid-binding SYLF domain-containing protein
MKNWIGGIVMLMFICTSIPGAVWAGSDEKDQMKAEHKREETNLMAKETLARLFEESPSAKELFDKTYGYAVFSNLKVSIGITGGGGSGVAVNKETDERTYMNMGTGGLNLGLGAQKYQVVFFFQTEKPFRYFVDKGWKADASANAVAGTKGANVDAQFINGMAVYQLTQAGLMLQADISGTKYWKNDKLNEVEEADSENADEAGDEKEDKEEKEGKKEEKKNGKED